jgi:hypothetical protein
MENNLDNYDLKNKVKEIKVLKSETSWGHILKIANFELNDEFW